ncbi:MAG: lipopolysaccharide transport system permease protein [bacterium]
MSHAHARPGPAASPAAPLLPAHERRFAPAVFWELVVHLARRQLEAKHQLTLLGWAWPLARQLAQLAVLVFVFSAVFNLNINNYAVFIFIGLIMWTWFSTGIGDAAWAVSGQRHMILLSRLPKAALPLVSVVVPLVDVLIAFPVLVLMLALGHELRWTLFAFLLVLPLQALLMAGFAWLAAAGSVFFRDVPNVVALGLTLLFYLTPVFYGMKSVPSKYQWLLELNPLTTIIECQRALLLGESAPGALRIAAVTAGSALLAAAGYLWFQRLEPRFADFQ